VQDAPVIASQLNDRVPPELDGLVLHALAKQPEDRFQSAEEMRDVVGYAHQALTQLGGWTGGRWDTGALPAAASRMTGTAPTIVQQGSGNGTTSQFPAPLLGKPAGTGHGDDEHGYGEHPPGGSGGNPWLKPVLFVIAAVVAIALGVLLATRNQGDGGGTPSSSTSPSVTQDDTTGQPSDQPTDEPTGSGETSTMPTSTQTDTPTGTPTTTAPTATTTAPPTTASTKPTTPPVTPTTTPPVTPTGTDPTTATADPSGGVLGGTSGQ